MPPPAAPRPSCLCDLGGPLPAPSPRVPRAHPPCRPVAAAPGAAQPRRHQCHANVIATRLRALGFVDDPPAGSGDPHSCSRRRRTTHHKTDLEPRHVPGRAVSTHLHPIVVPTQRATLAGRGKLSRGQAETLNPELHVPTGSRRPLPPASSGSNPSGEQTAPTCRYSVKKDPSSVFSSCLWAGVQSRGRAGVREPTVPARAGGRAGGRLQRGTNPLSPVT